MLPTELDFGMGTHQGEPLVGVTRTGSRFHRHDHRGRYDLITWTYDYVTNEGACGIWQPCPTCFPGHPEVRLIDGSKAAGASALRPGSGAAVNVDTSTSGDAGSRQPAAHFDGEDRG